jgi:hypothetical protein
MVSGSGDRAAKEVQDAATAVAIVITAFAIETFLFSIGWNIGLHPLFNLRRITIVESFGIVLLLKIAGLQLFYRRSSK